MRVVTGVQVEGEVTLSGVVRLQEQVGDVCLSVCCLLFVVVVYCCCLFSDLRSVLTTIPLTIIGPSGMLLPWQRSLKQLPYL